MCKLAQEQKKLMQHHNMIIALCHAEGNSAYLEVTLFIKQPFELNLSLFPHVYIQ